ncbi:MAG: pyridoxamine 5'-phosphate oxidase family protein [Rhodoferax sp.]
MTTPLVTEAQLRRHIWSELERATQDRHHEWRTPVLATLGGKGCLKRLGWQLRVHADMSVQTTGPEVQAAWAQVSQSAAAGDYLSASAPGDALPMAPGMPGAQTTVHHLAVLTAQVQQLDWLELGHGGHRRAVFGANTWEWRVP